MTTHSDSWWLDVFERFRSVHDAQELFARALEFTKQLGFSYCSYGIRIPVSMAQPLVAVLDCYPQPWMDHYAKNHYLAVDPTVQLGARNREAIVWSDELFARAQMLWNDARDLGLRFGLAQSSWGSSGIFGLLSLARESEPVIESELDELRPRLRWLAENLHERMQSYYAGVLAHDGVSPLSQREHEVLCWTADGKTSWETAQILRISERTVNFHIQNILSKLNAQNKVQAAVKAAALGLLSTGTTVSVSGSADYGHRTPAPQRAAESASPLPGLRAWYN